MKLDMLFFLGIFYTAFGGLLLGAWLAAGGAWNLYGLTMLGIGVVLLMTRPRPPLRFFLGRIEPASRATQHLQCWCGRLVDSGQVCGHGDSAESPMTVQAEAAAKTPGDRPGGRR